MDLHSAQEIRDALDTLYIGQNLIYYRSIPSTNQEARRLAEEGAPEGTLLLADYQSKGRGRLSRTWHAPPGGSLLLSLIFRPNMAPDRLMWLTMLCGLAAVDAIRHETGLEAGLKWPNDIMIAGAKAGGILTESGLRGGRVSYVIVGVGLNVNLDIEWLPRDLLVSATSISRELGRPVQRQDLLLAFLRSVESRYGRLKKGDSPSEEWSGKLVTLGQSVTASEGQHQVSGMAEGVDGDGALLIRKDNGELSRVVSGDVTLRNPGLLNGT